MTDATIGGSGFWKGRGFAEGLNLVLIAATCLVAHAYPYHLLLASYAVLGPAHYLTQISWLHDRRYFTRNAAAAFPVLAALAALYMLWPDVRQAGGLLAAAVVFSAFVAAAGNPACVAAGAAVAAGAGWLASKGGNAAFVVAILVPTVCHVFVFTWAFMLAGALRSGSRTAWAGVAAMLAAAATFLLPGGHYPAPTLAGLENFQPAADVLKSALPQELGTRVFGFLGFAYAYHYLNWFSKAEAIKWNRMPRERLMWIVGVYAFIECAYFRDFRLGFLVAMFPSVLHVLLEFPLNTATFASIGRAALNGGKRAA